jgi:hypothetical protein
MKWSDYAAIYAIQTLPEMEALPRGWWTLLVKLNAEYPELVNAAMSAASELFGQYDSPLYEVPFLTLEEGKIASRLDLTHPEKIERIRPLRKKRERDADKRSEKSAREYENKWEAEREEQIIAAVTETIAISDEDRFWASKLKIKLD